LTEHAPILVEELSSVVRVDAGCHHVAAIDDEGLLWMWGGNERGQCGMRNEEDEETKAFSSCSFLKRPVVVKELADEGDTIRGKKVFACPILFILLTTLSYFQYRLLFGSIFET
jgi:alpha-tubulin suppressor-like RCC1 family protein